MKTTFRPVILGANIHAYSVAASFHEDYGVKSLIAAADYLGYTKYTSIVERYFNDADIYNDETFLSIMKQIHQLYDKETLLLIPTTDEYMKLAIKHQKILKQWFKMNVPTSEQFEALYYKRNFQETCEHYGLKTPITYTISCKTYIPFEQPVMFPVILKVDNGTAYFNVKFEGKQKIYLLNTYEEVNAVIQKICQAGYSENLIIQEYIEGPDNQLYDIVYYGDQNGKGQVITFAQVILQEPAMTAVGNYTALISRQNQQLMDEVVRMMEAMQYTGFANFDMKYDKRDNTFKFFEVNLRVGRSSSYIKASGWSIARCYVADLIENQSHPLVHLEDTVLFTVVPKNILLNNVSHMTDEIRMLYKDKKVFNPLYYKKDIKPSRLVYLLQKAYKYKKKYRESEWQPNE